jgi:S-DNA-T family DNA segregation ATPase FtsK/SpoIIIE
VRDEPGADGRNHIADGKRGRRSFAQRTAGFRDHKARIEQDAAAALGAERQRRMAAAPDPAAVLTIATGPRRRLWERRGSDPDYLLLRVGTADLPSAVELQDPAQDEHRRTVVWNIRDAPVTVPLAERGVLGVAGPGDEPRALGRWLVAQIAVLHSPNDVQLCVLTDSSGQASWEWARWLPHAQQPGGGGAAAAAGALIGNDAETVGARIAELLAAISERQKILRESSASGGVRFGSIVVVLDGSRRLRWLPGCCRCCGRPGAAYSRSAWTPRSGCCPPSATRWPWPSAADCGCSR